MMLQRRRLVFGAVIICTLVVVWLIIAPTRWFLNLVKPVDLGDPVAAGATVVDQYECRSCHRIDGSGALKAPDLAGVSERLDAVSLRLWLRDPGAIKGNTPMPNLRLSDGEIEAVVAYLDVIDAEQ